MFGPINHEEVKENNERIEQEMHNVKEEEPKAEPKKSNPIKNVIGNILGMTGSTTTLIAGIGAGVVLFGMISAALGLNILYTILLLAGVGLTLSFIGSKLTTDNWMSQIQGA